MPKLDPDATIVIPRNRADKRERQTNALVKTAVVAIALSGALVGGTFLLFHGGHHPAPDSFSAWKRLPGTSQSSPLRAEAEILAQHADQLIAVRFDQNPRILVLDFPSLTSQGLAFNRIAAFVEKRGLSRDRVLSNVELADAIRADNATVNTYYYGHDYKAADLQRFFVAADRQGMTLEPAERNLRALLGREGLLVPGVNLAVISIPREGSDPFVDASGRASLLRHELSHGVYFTDEGYMDFVNRFWTTEMTADDRASFRGFLSRQGYDPGNEELMANEAQAHLMFTTDKRYFNAPACGLPVARVDALRSEFLSDMPPGWLHDAALASRSRLP